MAEEEAAKRPSPLLGRQGEGHQDWRRGLAWWDMTLGGSILRDKRTRAGVGYRDDSQGGESVLRGI